MVQAAAVSGAWGLHFWGAVPSGQVVTSGQNSTAAQPVSSEAGQVRACYGELATAAAVLLQ